MFAAIAAALKPSTDSRIHAGIAFVLSALLVWLTGDHWLAWVAPTCIFYGREMRDAEVHNNWLTFHIGRLGPWNWHEASRKEFLHPTIAAALPAIIAGLVL